jgi:hypothetical protein
LRVVVVGLLAVVVIGVDAPVVLSAPTVDPTEAAASSDAVRVESGPAPRSEPRDLAKELGGGVSGVDASGGLSGGSGPVPVSERVAEEVRFRSEGSETFRLRDGSNVTEFYGQPKWFREGGGEWARVDPRFVAGVDGSVSAVGVGFGVWIGASQEGVRLSWRSPGLTDI